MNWTMKTKALAFAVLVLCLPTLVFAQDNGLGSAPGPFQDLENLTPSNSSDIQGVISADLNGTSGATWLPLSQQRQLDNNANSMGSFSPNVSSKIGSNTTQCDDSGREKMPAKSRSAIDRIDSKSEQLLGESYFGKPKPKASVFKRVFAAESKVRRLWSLRGLYLTHDYDDSISLARDAVAPSITLSTGDANQDFGGFDANFLNRNEKGRGWALRYFGLFSDDEQSALSGPALTNLTGLSNLSTTAGTAQALFDDPAGIQSVSRSAEFHNFEINMLGQNKSCFLGFNVDLNESIYGFRYFSFDESLTYASTRSVPFGGASIESYDVAVENQLFGVQFGRRLEKQLRGRWGVSATTKFGVFNNRAESRQSLTRQDATGTVVETAAIVNNPPNLFDASDQKDDIAFLNEFDLGLMFQFTKNTRARIGYRSLGMLGVAIADDQIPADFNSLTIAQNANTDGDLYLNGGYFGIEIVR